MSGELLLEGVLGTKSLIANSTGFPGGLSSVGAVGVNSSGALLNGCSPLDTVEDGQPVGVIGGECLNAVKFWVQVREAGWVGLEG